MSNWKLKSREILNKLKEAHDGTTDNTLENIVILWTSLHQAESIATSALDMLEEIERLLDAGIDILVDSPMNDKISQFLNENR